MSYLKGNYNLNNSVDDAEPVKAGREDSESGSSGATFEEFARSKLGGSIAFVMKNSTFVWEGPAAEGASTTEGKND